MAISANNTGMRQRILEVAVDLFAHQSYEGTSFRDIAERLGITKAAVYYHFPAKEDLLAEVLDPLVSRLERLVERTEADDDRSLNRRALLAAYLDLLLEHRPVVDLLVREAAIGKDLDIGRRADDVHQRLSELLAGDAASEARMRAAAALGALRRPITVLPELDLLALRPKLLDAAMAALGAAPRPQIAAVTSQAIGGGPAPELSARATFRADPPSASAARAFVAATLGDWGIESSDSITLLTSELVTNAILHARTELDVTVRLFGHRARVEVRDENTRLPVPAASAESTTSGRGLVVVEALADAWGMERHRAGTKVVWFEVELP